MRFWIPYRGQPQDRPPFYTDDPNDPRLAGQRVQKSTMRIAHLDLVINGEYETNNAREVAVLMKVGGVLRFNPQDAVDEKILTVAQVKGLGFDVGEAEVEPEPVDIGEPVKPDVDIYTMSKRQMVEWGKNQEPPILLDDRKKKDDMIEAVLTELERRESEKLSKEK